MCCCFCFSFRVCVLTEPLDDCSFIVCPPFFGGPSFFCITLGRVLPEEMFPADGDFLLLHCSFLQLASPFTETKTPSGPGIIPGAPSLGAFPVGLVIRGDYLFAESEVSDRRITLTKIQLANTMKSRRILTTRATATCLTDSGIEPFCEKSLLQQILSTRTCGD